MTSKWSPHRTIVDHFDTLRDARTGRPRKLDYVEFFGLPAALGTITWYFGFRFETVDPLLAGTAIFTGLLFAVLIYVFTLRVRVLDSPHLSGNSRLAVRIDELEVNVSYTVLIGLLATAALMVISGLKEKDAPVSALATSIVVTLLLHLMMSVLLVLKRTRSAYSQVTR